MTAIFPEEFLTELKEKNDIVEVISNYTDLVPAGQHRFKGRCPLHKDDVPSLVVYQETQTYHCFGCNAGSRESGMRPDVIGFIEASEDVTFIDAVKLLAKRSDIAVPTIGPEVSSKLKEQMLRKAREYHRNLTQSERARSYLFSRGLSKDDLVKYKLGYVPEDDEERYSNCITIPIQNVRGEVTGIAFRNLSKGTKYLNTPETSIFKKSQLLYGLDYALNLIDKEKKEIVLVEGYFDTIHLQKLGIPAAAVMGSRLTEGQAELLSRHADTAILFMDGDVAGTNAAKPARELLSNYGVGVKIVPYIANKDPDDLALEMGTDLVNLVKDQACTIEAYVISSILRTYQSRVAEATSQAVKEIRTVLEEVPMCAERSVYALQAADLLRISIEDVYIDKETSKGEQEDIHHGK